ncbi:MAG: DegT/DnrJ/EryC1/StrS family aminotransferase [Oscillatoriaceae bacterium SKW80]|nr:DegT/DnrJ/EryC1/StrS family aminotransferase [Oscillatoriaceae bacterium SKYG93]MCX8119883.1 DegT/DnrJ/EryC1/StrS family aminotransferase [Oscillatoriaceae bacterium SKW80]MDW8452010.1 DegT/DnrJ/EryC1/StrS family aminotransferase [Oscillatoriaceae cyanobacterium SKYGB_i_bin93]HIK27548.1 DegT/DnrJ/EryC1/StrS family aminotransferase [Oscillatoriaceae cyanobacterium M7585_C2015_266]
MNNIPPLDLAQQYQSISEEITEAVLDVLASGRYIGGPWVESFEQQFASYIGVSECVACNSGTDALYLALRALKIGPGDEVITTPFTFVATAEAIANVGATPVFVDIDPDTYNLDINQIEAAINSRTRAILPVHLFGQPTDMTRLMAIANAHHLAVIEDCAQSTGAEWAGKKVGSIGHVGCFSFFPTKNLGACGDGGAVTTNDPAIAAQIRAIKDHGQTARYFSVTNGINSRLDALQAAILQIKLPYLDIWNQQRRNIAALYHQLLENFPGIEIPKELPAAKAVWNQYTIRLLAKASEGTEYSRYPDKAAFRDSIRTQLIQQGVSSMVYYPMPLHLQPVYESLGYKPGQLPVSEQLATEVLSLPIFPEMSREQLYRVVRSLKDCLTSSLPSAALAKE